MEKMHKKYIILIICLILMLGSGVFLISWMLENKNTDKIKKLETRFLSEYKDTYNLDDKILEDNYETIIYNDTVAFEHGCGAVGRCSYPGKEEYLKSKGKTSEY